MNNQLSRIIAFINHFFSAKRGGHGIHSPFAYTLCEQVFYNSNAYYTFKQLNAIRHQLLSQTDLLSIEDHGAGSTVFNSTTRSISQIAKSGISSQTQSELLFRLIQFLQLQNRLELGTSLGLTTQYICRAMKEGRTVTIEGSAALHHFAQQLAQKAGCHSIDFLKGTFDDALPELLKKQKVFDFVYIDGNHTQAATLRYFEVLLPHLHANSVLVLDDIYWSRGMQNAWQIISKHPQVTLSIDVFAMGLIFFKPELKEKLHLRLYIKHLV